MNKLFCTLVFIMYWPAVHAQNAFIPQQKMSAVRRSYSTDTGISEFVAKKKQVDAINYLFDQQFDVLDVRIREFKRKCSTEQCKEMNKEKIKYYESLEKKISDFNCLDKNTYDYISKLKEIYRTWRSGMFNLDTPELKRIDTVMRYCKQFYTDEFLTTTRPTKGFNLFKAALYDINKINDYIYNQKNIDIFQSASLQYTGNKVMVGAEVASLLVGPVRLGIGGSFESAGDSTDDAVKTSLQKIISNRGTVAINISFPFFYYRSRTNQLHLGVFGQMNNGFNPAIDTVTNKQNFSSFYYTNQSALNFYVDISSNDQKGRVFMEFPLIYSFGAADAYQDLKIADFWMLKTRLGVMINSLIGINITGPLWSSSKKIQSVPFTIGFNFSPSQITKAE